MTTSAKPCPFCAGENVLRGQERAWLMNYYLECGKCGARGPSVIVDPSRAVDAWNERREPQP